VPTPWIYVRKAADVRIQDEGRDRAPDAHREAMDKAVEIANKAAADVKAIDASLDVPLLYISLTQPASSSFSLLFLCTEIFPLTIYSILGRRLDPGTKIESQLSRHPPSLGIIRIGYLPITLLTDETTFFVLALKNR
jgi:hypothetical protein